MSHWKHPASSTTLTQFATRFASFATESREMTVSREPDMAARSAPADQITISHLCCQRLSVTYTLNSDNEFRRRTIALAADWLVRQHSTGPFASSEGEVARRRPRRDCVGRRQDRSRRITSPHVMWWLIAGFIAAHLAVPAYPAQCDDSADIR